MKLTEKARALKAALSERKQIRKQLRGPADLQYAIADRIDLLNQEAWHNLTQASSFFLSAAYLRGLEPVLPHNINPRYALIYDQNGETSQPIAAVYMQIADIGISEVRPEKPADKKAGSTKWLAPVQEKIIDSTRQRVLTCGNLLTYGQHGVALAPGVDANSLGMA
ncbi:MAG: hypothetical protein JNM52_00970 [Betaproteobacteria bacterium]|nr:hypothetical protein [Betaproteobacteria bacterium]